MGPALWEVVQGSSCYNYLVKYTVADSGVPASLVSQPADFHVPRLAGHVSGTPWSLPSRGCCTEEMRWQPWALQYSHLGVSVRWSYSFGGLISCLKADSCVA